MENENVQILADKIARLLRSESQTVDFSSLQLSIEKISQRLNNIEQSLVPQNPKSEIPNPKSNHSSQEKFLNLEELGVAATNGLKDEKACPFEPAGKPCDHCAMCNSRGF